MQVQDSDYTGAAALLRIMAPVSKQQRTQTINALRAHLSEQGIIAPTGPAHVERLAAIINADDGMLPAAVCDLARLSHGCWRTSPQPDADVNLF